MLDQIKIAHALNRMTPKQERIVRALVKAEGQGVASERLCEIAACKASMLYEYVHGASVVLKAFGYVAGSIGPRRYAIMPLTALAAQKPASDALEKNTLTPTEQKLFDLLLDAKGAVAPRAAVYALFPRSNDVGRLVKVHVCHIRSKRPDYEIVTVHGVGLRMTKRTQKAAVAA